MAVKLLKSIYGHTCVEDHKQHVYLFLDCIASIEVAMQSQGEKSESALSRY